VNRRLAIPRHGKSRLAVLLGVFLVLALVVLWVWWRRAPTQPDLEAGRVVAETFLNLIRAGQAGRAWESTTAEFKSAEGRESFVAYAKKQTLLAGPVTFVAVQTVTIGDSPRAEYVYRAADGSGTVRLLAGNERGIWRIDRIRID
jgi:hypothetical protein